MTFMTSLIIKYNNFYSIKLSLHSDHPSIEAQNYAFSDYQF